jgi:serine protease AprX
MDILTGEDAMKGHSTGMIKCSPNPFKDETRIEYFSGEVGLMTIDIYNLPGRKIKTFETASDGQGMYSVTWDGKDVAGTAVPAGI